MSGLRQVVVLALAAMVSVGTGRTSAGAEGWLTPPEQELFAALGLDGKFEGKTYHRKPNYESLVEIGNRAPEPLKTQILALAKAYPKLSLSPEQIKEFRALLESAAEKAQGELRKAALGGLLDPDGNKDRAAKATNALLEDPNGPIRTAWKKQTGWYLERAAAREALAKNMDLVTAELDKRVGKTRPETDLTVSLGAEKGTLVISGKVGPTPLTSPVVQVVIHKAKANGGLMALDLTMNGLLQSMGVSNMSLLPGKAGLEATAFTAAQQKEFDLPVVKTFGLPKLSARSQFTLDVDEDLNDVIFFERVSLKVWTAEGTITVDSVPSIEAVQKLREEVPRDDRFKDTASKAPAPSSTKSASKAAAAAASDPPLTPPPGFSLPSAFGEGKRSRKPTAEEAKANEIRQQAQEMQANSTLNLARAAIAKKQNDQARIFLNQVIASAPDSKAAVTAKGLLKKLGP